MRKLKWTPQSSKPSGDRELLSPLSVPQPRRWASLLLTPLWYRVQDKSTSEFRIVPDASVKMAVPSLNDYLYTGPSFGWVIFLKICRGSVYRVSYAVDSEKALLKVSVEHTDSDLLRFLWVCNINREIPEVMILWFTCIHVPFVVGSWPLLLNAILKHHMDTYHQTNPLFVDKSRLLICVDDFSFGADHFRSNYELYLRCKLQLAEAGFNLEKFVTNLDKLCNWTSLIAWAIIEAEW